MIPQHDCATLYSSNHGIHGQYFGLYSMRDFNLPASRYSTVGAASNATEATLCSNTRQWAGDHDPRLETRENQRIKAPIAIRRGGKDSAKVWSDSPTPDFDAPLLRVERHPLFWYEVP